MKKIIIIVITVLLVIIVNFNFTSSNSSSGILSLENLQALQSSAGEAYCDPTTSNYCEIRLPNGEALLVGVGQPVIIY